MNAATLEVEMRHASFVWFDNRSAEVDGTARFYAELFGWEPMPGPGDTVLFAGAHGPAAGVRSGEGGWLPYAEVADVEAAVARATALGASVREPVRQGPAGRYAVVQDPGGATVALWQRTP